MIDGIDIADLPSRLAELAQITDLVATLKLVQKRGGTRIWIPHEPAAHHDLTRIVGLAAARKMRDYYGGGDWFQVDKAEPAVRAARDRAIVAAHNDGVSVERLARDYGLTMRTIWRILAAAGIIDDNQSDLFATG